MASRTAAKRWPALEEAGLSAPPATVPALLWAAAASTLHRVRRGEGALLAVNLSLILYQDVTSVRGLAAALVSLLTIALMYAFNDLYDAPLDVNNPKKDQACVAAYLDHRGLGGAAIFVLHLVTIALAFACLDARASLAVTAAMLVNLLYSIAMKGMPVADVIVCGLWGAAYAAIVDPSPSLVILVGLMTAVCHLYQTLDDRAADAANAIITTAVRSPVLSRNVLVGLSALLFAALCPTFGVAWALTAFTPLAIFLACDSPRAGWLLTKVYFGAMWLSVLEIAGAAG
jgi:4-hydroxybenzoate polyprenyltransferase